MNDTLKYETSWHIIYYHGSVVPAAGDDFTGFTSRLSAV